MNEEIKKEIKDINRNMKKMVNLLTSMHKTHTESIEKLIRAEVEPTVIPEQAPGEHRWKQWEMPTPEHRHSQIPAEYMKTEEEMRELLHKRAVQHIHDSVSYGVLPTLKGGDK